MDLSQCPEKRARGGKPGGALPTLLTSTRLYSRIAKRVLLPPEALATHGLPVEASHSRLSMAPRVAHEILSHNQGLFAAGNAMSVPCVGAVVFAAIMALDPA